MESKIFAPQNRETQWQPYRGILYEVLEPNQSNSIGVGSFVSAGRPWRGFHVEMF